MADPRCRFCAAPLTRTFADLGMSPLSNSYLTREQLGCMEPYYPLHALVCDSCLLVQLEEYGSPQNIFRDYAYFSSYSDTWLEHAAQYTRKVVEQFSLSKSSHVVEIASNDGYLLRNFKAMEIPVMGIEPAENVAQVAQNAGIPTRVEFFGTKLAEEMAAQGLSADLLIGNNVLAHVPPLNDFVQGMKIALKPHGIITMEFPHLLRLIEGRQFDTIYHEHFSYFSFLTVERIFQSHGLTIFDVEELSTHGGSLRIYACHVENKGTAVTERVFELRACERRSGLDKVEGYSRFAEYLKEAKRNLLACLIDIKRAGKSIAGYGAPAKGNTLLTYCGIGRDFLDYTVDRNPYKQQRYLPGTRVPIYAPERIRETRPDYVFVLPWNIASEIIAQLSYIREWGGRFLIPIPRPEVRS